MTLIDVLLAVLIISGTALCIYFIISLKRLTNSVDSIKGDFNKLVDESIPVIENINKITEHAVSVSSTTERQVHDLNNKIEDIKNKVFSFREKVSKASTDNQVITLINNMRAVVKGISAFIKDISK